MFRPPYPLNPSHDRERTFNRPDQAYIYKSGHEEAKGPAYILCTILKIQAHLQRMRRNGEIMRILNKYRKGDVHIQD